MRDTHVLGTAEGVTGQDMVRKRPGERYLLPGDRRGREKSEHRKKVTEREALTPWRPQRERQVGTRKESDRVRGTHILKRSPKEGQDGIQKETGQKSRNQG